MATVRVQIIPVEEFTPADWLAVREFEARYRFREQPATQDMPIFPDESAIATVQDILGEAASHAITAD